MIRFVTKALGQLQKFFTFKQGRGSLKISKVSEQNVFRYCWNIKLGLSSNFRNNNVSVKCHQILCRFTDFEKAEILKNVSSPVMNTTSLNDLTAFSLVAKNEDFKLLSK